MPNDLVGVIQPEGFPGLPEGWGSELETYPSADGRVRLFSASYRKLQPAPGLGHRALIICHGIGEHGGRYLHFPHYLQNSVDVVFCPDHRGHGRSEGLRGHVDQFKEYSEDFALSIRKLDEKLKVRYGKSEIHVLGHSLGSLIMLEALFDHSDLPIRSACASSPLMGLRVAVPIVKKVGAIALSRIWGSIQMSSELDASLLSHDRAVVTAYQKDRLVHPKITPRLFTEMQSSMQAIVRQKKEFPYPLQMIVPMEDRIVDPGAALEFYRTLVVRDKQLKTYPDFYHESFNELGKERAFEDLQEWIKQHSDTH